MTKHHRCFFLALSVVHLSALEPQVSFAFLSSCFEPRKPSCISSLGMRDEFSFKSCRSDVDAFRRETEEYLRCLDRQKDDAVDEFNKAVEEFNCYAKGNTIC